MTLTTAAQSGLVSFNPRARLLKLIGAELISDEVVAITELVKNAHDADASYISIQFSSVTMPDGEILVRDDGHGMDLDTLLTRWMQPAGSGKGREGARYTRAGRRVLGDKGVGRFAADKLAASLELVSRRQGEPQEIRAVFDWDEFDADEKMLSDVRSRWDLRAPEWLDSQGTVLRLSRLRACWNERMFRRLSTRLSRLISPFESSTAFRIRIESDEFPEYTGDVTSGYLDAAPYRVEAEFDGVSSVSVRINGARATRHPWSGEGRLSCGPVKVRLYAFDLETESLAKIGRRIDVRAWLREWSGVSVYRDSFRIWPYGEPSDDWLRLDQRRVNNPVTRLSNNQVVGFVEISADANPELRDQTNREGLIHNEALADLQRFILFSMQLLEAERQALRHPGGKRKDKRLVRAGTNPDFASMPDALERLAKQVSPELGDELRRTASRARTQIAGQEATRRKMLDGYSELAALGHSAALLGRSVELELEAVRVRLDGFRRSLGTRTPPSVQSLKSDVEEIESVLADAASRLSLVTAPQQSKDASRRRRALDVPTELDRARNALRPLLEQAHAELIIEAPTGALLRTEMRPEIFSAIIHALVRNSLEWCTPLRPPRITFVVSDGERGLELLASDNGRGVRQGLTENVFEPGVSGRDGGAGMGLTLVRNIINSHGGTIELLTDRRRRGATFRIVLARKRSRAT